MEFIITVFNLNNVLASFFHLGATAGDEMCNLYLMYYTEYGPAGYQSCMNEQTPVITASLPEDSDEPPPRNPLLEEHAKHRNAHLKKGDLESLVNGEINIYYYWQS